jgi:class 3 adenylate cyclase
LPCVSTTTEGGIIALLALLGVKRQHRPAIVAVRGAERLARAQRWRSLLSARSSFASAYLGDVVEESDGDLMVDGVNIAARLEGIAKLG